MKEAIETNSWNISGFWSGIVLIIFQIYFKYIYMHFPPDAAFFFTMFTGFPFTFTEYFQFGEVDNQMRNGPLTGLISSLTDSGIADAQGITNRRKLLLLI